MEKDTIESMEIPSLLSSGESYHWVNENLITSLQFYAEWTSGWNFLIFGENNLLCLTILHKNINKYCQLFPAHINGYFFQWFFSITADILLIPICLLGSRSNISRWIWFYDMIDKLYVFPIG